MPDPLVLAQPVFRNPDEPFQAVQQSIAFGQGLRERIDAAQREKVLQQRQDAEFNRQERIRSLFSEGKVDEAKGLMSLQERAQLVNIQAVTLNNQEKTDQLDQTEKALNDVAGFRARLAAINPKADNAEEQVAQVMSDASDVIGGNPQYAQSLAQAAAPKLAANKVFKSNTEGTLENYQKRADLAIATNTALDAEQATQLRSQTSQALSTLSTIQTSNVNPTEFLASVQQWEQENALLIAGPTGKVLADARDNLFKKKLESYKADTDRMKATSERSGGTSAFERIGQQMVSDGTLTLQEWDSFKNKFLTVATTARTGLDPFEQAILDKLSGGTGTAQPTGSPVSPTQTNSSMTRQQLLDGVRSGRISKDEAKRIAREQGIQ
jgi:hypothetical protein